MIMRFRRLIIKYQEILLYVFLGGCTTVINIGVNRPIPPKKDTVNGVFFCVGFEHMKCYGILFTLPLEPV